jgi:hypothetical protein
MNIWRAAGTPITTSGEVFCGQRSTNISERLISKGHRLSGKFNLNGRRLKQPVEQAYSRKKNTVNSIVFLNCDFILFLHDEKCFL